MPFLPLSFALQWLVIVLACAAATWVRFEVAGVLGTGFPFITYLPVVILITFLFGARAGLITAVVTALAAWLWFIPPAGSFALDAGGAAALTFYGFTNLGLIGFFYWLQWANRALLVEREANVRLAQTRELLFRELQHRVSNNLQMVAALLTVQRRQIEDPHAKAALEEASRRLSVIGRISRQLYDPQGSGQELGSFLDQLTRDVLETAGRSDVVHTVETAEAAQLTPEASIPIALVVAEAISNAVEHGFTSDQTDCALTIRLDPASAGRLMVEVEDNGRGLPSNFSLERSESLGLRIATMLAGQLGGSFALEPGSQRGAVARLELPLTA